MDILISGISLKKLRLYLYLYQSLQAASTRCPGIYIGNTHCRPLKLNFHISVSVSIFAERSHSMSRYLYLYESPQAFYIRRSVSFTTGRLHWKSRYLYLYQPLQFNKSRCPGICICINHCRPLRLDVEVSVFASLIVDR